MAKVRIYTEKQEDTAEKLVYAGELDLIPRVGEFVEISDEFAELKVLRVIHVLPKKRVNIYLPADHRDRFKAVKTSGIVV